MGVQRILEITEQQMVTTYLNYSMPLSTVLGREQFSEWIYEHFTNIYLVWARDHYVWYDYLEDTAYMKDIAQYTFIKASEVKRTQNFVSLVKSYIDEEYYVNIHIDRYYYEECSFYHGSHKELSVLIYGYDDNKQLFYCCGFDPHWNAGTITMRYDNLQLGVEQCLTRYTSFSIWADWYFITLLRVKESQDAYRYHPEIFLNELRAFTDSVNLENRMRPEVKVQYGDAATFGIASQYEYLEALKELAKGNYVTDYRHVHLLQEQKRLITKKLEVTFQHMGMERQMEEIIPVHKELVNGYYMVSRRFMKAALRDSGTLHGQIKRQKDIFEIYDKLGKLTEKEEKLYHGFL